MYEFIETSSVHFKGRLQFLNRFVFRVNLFLKALDLQLQHFHLVVSEALRLLQLPLSFFDLLLQVLSLLHSLLLLLLYSLLQLLDLCIDLHQFLLFVLDTLENGVVLFLRNAFSFQPCEFLLQLIAFPRRLVQNPLLSAVELALLQLLVFGLGKFFLDFLELVVEVLLQGFLESGQLGGTLVLD